MLKENDFCDNPEMAGTLIERIDQRLNALGLNDASAARDAGLGNSFIRDIRRKGSRPAYRNVIKLAKVLKCSPEFLLEGAVADSPTTYSMSPTPVVGTVKAGAYRDITLENQDKDFPTVEAPHNARFPSARQYALLVDGDSMDELILDGHYALCVDFAETGLAMETGLIVHVENRISGTHIIETTLKQIERKGDKFRLMPRSSNKAHKPIELVGGESDETVIRGLVVGTYKPLF